MKTAVVILFASALCDVGICILRNLFAKNSLENTSDNTLNSILVTAAALPVLFILSKCQKPDGATLSLAFLFGLLIAFEQFIANEAFKNGSFALSSFMAQAGMLIAVIDACLVWGERLTSKSTVGILLMLLAMAFMMNVGKDKTSFRWFIFALLWMFACGYLAVVQKIFAERLDSADMYVFLFYSFLFSVAFLLLVLFINVKLLKVPLSVKLTGKIAGQSVLTGVLYMGLHIYALIGVGSLPASYFFPVCNGLKLAAEVVTGALLFKEKLTKKQMMGLVIGLVALLLLS